MFLPKKKAFQVPIMAKYSKGQKAIGQQVRCFECVHLFLERMYKTPKFVCAKDSHIIKDKECEGCKHGKVPYA